MTSDDKRGDHRHQPASSSGFSGVSTVHIMGIDATLTKKRLRSVRNEIVHKGTTFPYPSDYILTG